MTPTLEQVYGWFDEFNQQIFEGKLPRITIKFNNTYHQLGQFWWKHRADGCHCGIKISLYYDRAETQYRTCLLHEMCHQWCYNEGYLHEHHGENWQTIAAYATKVTGLNITRCEDITGWKVAENNIGKPKRAPRVQRTVVVDLEYDTHHFLVKIGFKGLSKYVRWDGEFTPLNGRIVGLYNGSDSMFSQYQTSRSLAKGYKYVNSEYNKRIAPKLEEMTSFLSYRNAYWAWG